MREIKFREFVNGKFHYWGFTEEGIFKGPVTPSLTRGQHQQFTGLKDKNGREIYEGDIVQRGVIVFHNGKFQGQYFSEGVMYELWEDDLCQEKGIEVIGNIHQHPELIS